MVWVGGGGWGVRGVMGGLAGCNIIYIIFCCLLLLLLSL